MNFTPSQNEEKQTEKPTEKPTEKKTRKTRQTKPATQDTSNLAKTLQGLHAVIAMGLALPELMLTEDESKVQADAIAAVMAEYEIPVSPATQALVNLAFVSFAIYAPRIHAIKERKKLENAEVEEEEKTE